jgi:hypothetical protein
MAPSHFQFACKMVSRSMTLTQYGGKPKLTDSIQRLKAYGMKIRFTMNTEGVVVGLTIRCCTAIVDLASRSYIRLL